MEEFISSANLNKNNDLPKVFSNELFTDFLKLWFESIKKASNQCSMDYMKRPLFYSFRNTKPTNFSASVKENVVKEILLTAKFNELVKVLKSHGVEYFLCKGEAFICFKKMNNKGFVNGIKTDRFRNSIDGEEKVHYSKKMMDNLAEMGIHKPIPIFYIGYITNSLGGLVDIKIVNYLHGKINFEASLFNMFEENIFTQSEPELVRPKLKIKKGLRKAN